MRLLHPMILILLAAGVLPVRAQNWTTSQTPAMAGAPQCVAIGDFNGDGIPDLVVGTSSDVSILIGNGDGTFQPSINIPSLGSPYGQSGGSFSGQAIAVANFLTGGPLDVIQVDNSTSTLNNVVITITDGTGHLASQTFFSLPFGSASAVATGAFVAGGSPGFAVTYQNNNAVSIYIGNGDGTFRAPTTYPTGSGPTSIVVGNFSGHGNVDLATANSGDNTVTVLLNNGNGTFGAPLVIRMPSGLVPVSIAAGDLGSGHTDLVVGLPR
jgi:hypothetical protein